MQPRRMYVRTASLVFVVFTDRLFGHGECSCTYKRFSTVGQASNFVAFRMEEYLRYIC